jgi:hypothetical protein
MASVAPGNEVAELDTDNERRPSRKESSLSTAPANEKRGSIQFGGMEGTTGGSRRNIRKSSSQVTRKISMPKENDNKSSERSLKSTASGASVVSSSAASSRGGGVYSRGGARSQASFTKQTSFNMFTARFGVAARFGMSRTKGSQEEKLHKVSEWGSKHRASAYFHQQDFAQLKGDPEFIKVVFRAVEHNKRKFTSAALCCPCYMVLTPKMRHVLRTILMNKLYNVFSIVCTFFTRKCTLAC